MAPDDKPALRPWLEAVRDGDEVVVHDRLRLSDAVLRLGPRHLRWVGLCDGTHTLREMSAAVGLPLAASLGIAGQLDEVLFLDTPRFRAALAAPVRRPACVGAYDGDPGALREQVRGLFLAGAGLPGPFREGPPLRGVLAPHIDYGRGGPCYTYAFKELAERCPASLFVIVGTSHYSSRRFTLTRKHFATPLGVTPTDGPFVDRVVAAYGDGLFDDEHAAHLPEHSIELEVVFLQWLFAGRREVRIVPLLVGSFHDCVKANRSPDRMPDIARMVAALKAAERDAGEPVAWVVSGDLAHIGPKFGDDGPVTDARLRHSRGRDKAILAQLESRGKEGYFAEIAAEGDARRICGLPPTWLTAAVCDGARFTTLNDDCCLDPQGQESVSFASGTFEG